MKTNIEFSECLNSIISTLDISANRLSKAINVDSSLVNRWVNGKRIPAYGTTYIESIAEYLSKNILNSFQMQNLNELFLNICEDNEEVDSAKEKILKVLLEAQGYSIENRRKERVKTNKDQNKPTHAASLIQEEQIIFGIDKIISVAVCLIETAAQKNGSNNTIYITMYNDINLNHYYHLILHVGQALLKAINNDWNLIFLLRLNDNIKRTMGLIKLLKPLLKTGRFNPFFINKYESITAGKETIIIPQIGALSCLATKTNLEINSAFFIKNTTAIEILENYHLAFLANYSQSLVKYYSTENILEFNRCLTLTENYIGTRYLYSYNFSVLTMPENLYIKSLKKVGFTNNEILLELETYRDRLKAFLSNIKHYKYYDIYWADAINFLIKNRQFCFHSHKGIKMIDLENQEIIDHLQNIINLLEGYENYNIALMQGFIDNDTFSDNPFLLLIKERQTMLLEVLEQTKTIPKVRLSIKEPMSVKTVIKYFEEIWEEIAPINKNKKEVITWIQEQINILRNEAKLIKKTNKNNFNSKNNKKS